MSALVLTAEQQRAYRAATRLADEKELKLTHTECQLIARAASKAAHVGPESTAVERARAAIVALAFRQHMRISHPECVLLAETTVAAIRSGRPVDLAMPGRPRLTGDGPLGLREDELDVLRLLGAGWTVRQVAAELDVTRHAVEYRIKRLFSALGVDSRAALIQAAKAAGVVPGMAAAS